jgi:hypothetical protein
VIHRSDFPDYIDRPKLSFISVLQYLERRCARPIQATAQIGSHSQAFTHNSADPGKHLGSLGFTFTADSPTMTLSILGNSVPAGREYLGLDNVSVSAVPAPAAVWLFGTGFLTLLGMS